MMASAFGQRFVCDDSTPLPPEYVYMERVLRDC
jgi:hypothetical protein